MGVVSRRQDFLVCNTWQPGQCDARAQTAFFTTEKAKDPVFKQIPIVCFTSTKRNDLFEPGYWKCMNPVFKALLGTNEKFPVTKENLAVIERKNDLGVPRVLVSARGFIMRSAQMVLRQGTHTPKSLKYCQEDLESRN